LATPIVCAIVVWFTNERSDLRQMSNQMKRIMKKLELRLTAQCIWWYDL